MEKMNRRLFFKRSAVGLGAVIPCFALKPDSSWAGTTTLKTTNTKETTTICPYCGVGCGLIVSATKGKIINIEGDPDHPINEGALCSKGAALYQVGKNERRLKKVLYRAPNSDKWEEKTWEWALPEIAKRIKDARDETFQVDTQITVKTEDGGEKKVTVPVNRTKGIAQLGGAAHDTEECYLLVKFARALGLYWIEHQARICHSSTVAALGSSFGRGAMTNHFNDMQNSDVVMIMGSNAAEMHPLSLKWIMKAKENGAKIISSDPRFTRTSSVADVFTKFRSGTDIAYVGGMINYAIQNNRIQKEYVVDSTNASFIINDEYSFDEGLFAGYDESKRKYDKGKWKYKLDDKGIPMKDPTLEDPRCVFQLMKEHYKRYDVDMVCNITGTPKDQYLKACDVFTSTYTTDKSATWCYAMGSTQHTVGTQYIRSYVVIQLLLGNMGIAGGGINALRGESNVQGSTDMCLLYHILPGYLKTPVASDDSIKAYIEHYSPKNNDPKSANWWGNYSRYITSLLKAWWPDSTDTDNGGFNFNYLAKREGMHDHIHLFENMYKGNFKGAIFWGQNSAVGGPNSNKERKAMEQLDWMVVSELWETETAQFWKRPGVKSADIKTEVFLLPACSSVEKEGSITNSGRWAQWRYAAIHPEDAKKYKDSHWHGDARSDLWMVDSLMKELKKAYKKGGKKDALPEAITKLHWEYGTGDKWSKDKEPNPHLVAAEINGYQIENGKPTKKQVKNFVSLKDDGSTASGNWLYCGGYVDWSDKEGKKTDPHYVKIDGKEYSNRYAKRINEKTEPAAQKLIKEGRAPGLNLNWSWCWPINRRIIYNRASVIQDTGAPRNPKRWVIRWNADLKGGKGAFEGDVPDGGWAPGTKYPFIMNEEGHARIFSPKPNDGPLPEHYEPLESPVDNPMSKQQINPAIVLLHEGDAKNKEMNAVGKRDKFPIVATTFRLSEHWQAGAMTRNLPWLAELMPDVFVELSHELAEKKGINNGDSVLVTSARGEVKAFALVTARFEAFVFKEKDGTERKIHQIGLPWHYGYAGIATGDSANLLTPHVGDANTNIPEYKAFLCDIKKLDKKHKETS